MAVTLNPKDFIPTTNSQASEWILWHKALKKRYGQATANTLWLKAWGKRGCEGIGCDSNTVELREYVSEQGIEIEGGTWDFIPDTWDDIKDFTTQAFNVGFYIGLAIVIIIIVFLGLLAWNIGRDPQATIAVVGDSASKLAAAKGGMAA